jgi:hypothetical protein
MISKNSGSYLLADVLQDDENFKLESLTSVTISMILSDCQHDVFMVCSLDSETSRTKQCGAKSLSGAASHEHVSLVSGRGFFPLLSSTCRLSWRMYDQEIFATPIGIFERSLLNISTIVVTYPNSEEISISGNDFLASQARLTPLHTSYFSHIYFFTMADFFESL